MSSDSAGPWLLVTVTSDEQWQRHTVPPPKAAQSTTSLNGGK